MYNRILKNNQVFIGNSFEIKTAYAIGGRNIHKVSEEQVDVAYMDDPETLIEEAKEEAILQFDLIIKDAKLEAGRIIKEAEAESSKKAMIYELEARKTGYETGLNEGKLKYERLIRETEEIKSKVETDYHEFVQSIEETSVRMILNIAKKVIAEEMCMNKDNILLLVRQAFERCTNKENAILKVSNDDYDYILENKGNLIALLGGIEDIEIRKDSSLVNGSCLVESQFGTIDAGVETKLKNIQEEFERLIKTPEH